jgi:hypothetical protein
VYEGRIDPPAGPFDARLIAAGGDNVVTLGREWLHLQRDFIGVFAKDLEKFRPAVTAVPIAGPRNRRGSFENKVRIRIEEIQDRTDITAAERVIQLPDQPDVGLFTHGSSVSR